MYIQVLKLEFTSESLTDWAELNEIVGKCLDVDRLRAIHPDLRRLKITAQNADKTVLDSWDFSSLEDQEH